jgi:uncharacterized protein YkwD
VGAFVFLFVLLSLGLGQVQKLVIRGGHTQLATVISSSLIDLLNADRASNNLPHLTLNEKLTVAAQAKANDMAEKGYFAHNSPTGVEPWHWFQVAGYSFQYAGENLAIDFADSSDVETAWMKSPTHRANIVDVHYTEVGIATAVGIYEGHQTTFVVQEFGSPVPVAGAPTPRAPLAVAPVESHLATTPQTPHATPAVKVLATAPIVRPVATNEITSEVLGVATLPKAMSSSSPRAVASIDPTTDTPHAFSIIDFALSFPRSTLQYIFYLCALIIVGVLAIETELEWHRKHLQSAMMAGGMLAFTLMLFTMSNSFVFSTPVLTQNAAMTAAVYTAR